MRFRDFAMINLVFEFLVLGSWFLVLGSGFWVLGSGFWVLGSWFWVLGFWFWVLGSGRSRDFAMLDLGFGTVPSLTCPPVSLSPRLQVPPSQSLPLTRPPVPLSFASLCGCAGNNQGSIHVIVGRLFIAMVIFHPRSEFAAKHKLRICELWVNGSRNKEKIEVNLFFIKNQINTTIWRNYIHSSDKISPFTEITVFFIGIFFPDCALAAIAI